MAQCRLDDPDRLGGINAEADPVRPADGVHSPRSFVRHYEYAVRVDPDVRELADTQFRFVAGPAGDGTESLQSENYPNRYLRVVDGTVRIDPVEEGTAYAGQASFRRVPTNSPTAVSRASSRSTLRAR